MRAVKKSVTSLYLILREVIFSSIERTWIPLSMGVNRHSLAHIPALNNDRRPYKVILVPYGTPACRFQFRSLAAHIKRNGQIAIVAQPSIISESPDSYSFYQDLAYTSFDDLVQGIIELCQGDLIYATGVVDSFMATCSPNTFFENFVLTKDFIRDVHTIKSQAENLIFEYSAIVLADGAYMFNRALISSALSAGRRVYIFNPHGDWLEFTRDFGELHRDFASYIKKLSPKEYAFALGEANAYLSDRFKGKQKDLDSPGVFSEKTKPIYSNPKKVLFMHIFRDANQVQLDPESIHQSLFSSYFEWADFCLREVAKKPDEWKVKLHPSSKFKNNEIEIQHLLLRKHGISLDLIDSCPTTTQILENRWPIFTHSGTIALESAIFGYRSHVCSGRHPEKLVHLAQNESQLTEQLRKAPNTIEETLDPVDVDMARLLLHWIFKHDLPFLGPKNPQPDRRSAFKFQLSLLSQEFSLMGRYIRPSTQMQLQKMAQEIYQNLP